jgi:hypothetical protein
MMRKIAILIALIVATLSYSGAGHAQSVDSDSSEYLVKAGFIFNFAKFVEWPAGSLGSKGTPIVIGVLGNEHFASILDQVVGGKSIDGRAFVVRRMKWGKEVKECHILFITSTEESHSDELLQLVKGASILTIGETPGFAKRGGMINFTLEDRKVRFEVNLDAAKHENLNISSRLLSLAKIVQASALR